MSSSDLRNWRMEQALVNAVTVVDEMIARQILPRADVLATIAKLHDRDRSSIAHTMWEWVKVNRPHLAS